MRRISLPVVALTLGGLIGGAICALLTSHGIRRFEVDFSFPDHPHGYLFSSRQVLVLATGLGGILGLSQALGLRRTVLLKSSLLALGLTTLLIALAYVVRFHAAPDRVAVLHMVVGAAALALPTLLLPAVAVGGIGLQRFGTRSATWILPAYILLQALSGWTFWQFLIHHPTHHIFGWMNGAVYGAVQSGILVFLARRTSPETAICTDSPRWGGPAIVLGVGASLLWLTLSALSWNQHRDRSLEFEATDRRWVLTIDDLKDLRGFRDFKGSEQVAKTLHGDGTLVLSYTAYDATIDALISSQVTISRDTESAAISHLMMEQAIQTTASALPDSWSRISDPQFVPWSGKFTALRMMDGMVLRGVIFSGTKDRVMVLFALAAEGEGMDAEALRARLEAVLERLPK